jgi:hypothetical protein
MEYINSKEKCFICMYLPFLSSAISMIKSRRMRGVGHIVHVRDMKNAYRVLVRKLEGKRPLGRLMCRWEGNIRMDRRKIGWEGVDWMHLTHNRYQRWAHEHGNKPLGSIKGREFLDWLSNCWLPKQDFTQWI